ncbi:unnamed protein product [Urochloa decumbens]|uniref:Uncharacterized protein n=1 Tax=Urochloa decumbens TaxID=240449 RepID=A0ABC9GF30_9POAL
MAAAAAAKVLRGGCSVHSSRPLLPAILQHLGLSPAGPVAGAARLMHTGLFGTRGVGTQGQLKTMDQFSGKRFMSSGDERRPRPPPSFIALGVASAVGFVIMGMHTFAFD